MNAVPYRIPYIFVISSIKTGQQFSLYIRYIKKTIFFTVYRTLLYTLSEQTNKMRTKPVPQHIAQSSCGAKDIDKSNTVSYA